MKARLIQSGVLKFRQVFLETCILRGTEPTGQVGWNDLAVSKASLVVLCSLSLIKVIIKTLLLSENSHPLFYKC